MWWRARNRRVTFFFSFPLWWFQTESTYLVYSLNIMHQNPYRFYDKWWYLEPTLELLSQQLWGRDHRIRINNRLLNGSEIHLSWRNINLDPAIDSFRGPGRVLLKVSINRHMIFLCPCPSRGSAGIQMIFWSLLVLSVDFYEVESSLILISH